MFRAILCPSSGAQHVIYNMWYIDRLFFYQLDAQILYFNTFITFIYMFRALLCSSSGGQYSIWYGHSLWVTVTVTQRVTIPDALLLQLSSWRWA